jgi:hypothetical protein
MVAGKSWVFAGYVSVRRKIPSEGNDLRIDQKPYFDGSEVL